MLKAEQVPLNVRNAISAARKNGASSAEIAAAAINAWPGMEQMRRRNGQGKGFFLPLPQEARDE